MQWQMKQQSDWHRLGAKEEEKTMARIMRRMCKRINRYYISRGVKSPAFIISKEVKRKC